MADYEVLAPGGHENLINNITERLDEKAYIDGYYAQLTAGAADSLTGRGDGVSASYLYRTTGGDADVADGTATVKSIHGRTVVWNQLMQNGDFASASGWGGDNATVSVADGVLSVSPSASGLSTFGIRTSNADASAEVVGHKYLVAVDINASVECRVNPIVYGVGSTITINTANVWQRIGHIFTLGTTVTGYTAQAFVSLASGTFDTSTVVQFRNFTIFDLTAMFEAGNEPSTVAEFEAIYPEPYYPYDAGSLLSVQMEGIETVGFNAYDPATGTAKLLGGNAYQITGTYTAIAYSTGETLTPDSSGIFTPTANGTLTVTGGNATDTCVHLVWSGYRNGEYEPYWKSERTIPAATYFPQGMRSAGTVYDELTSDAAVTRMGAVDLGTLTWSANTDTIGQYFYATLTGAKPASSASVAGNIECAKYDTAPSNSVQEKNIAISGNNSTLYVRDTTYETAAAFNTAMSGVMLHYALTTPTTTPITPPLNLTYRVSDFGTERIMVPVNEQSAPPTMQVVYGLNVVDTVRRLPTEYISHDSHENFVDALESELGVTVTETFDSTDNEYKYSIAPTDGVTLAQTKSNVAALRDLVEGTISVPESWAEIAEMAATGQGSEGFFVGTQLVDKFTDSHGSSDVEYDMPWNVVHFESAALEDNSTVPVMMLQSHYALPFATQFDNIEAFYAVPASGIAAGTYSVTFGVTWGKVTENSTYSFTLSNSYEEGAQLAFSGSIYSYAPETLKVNAYATAGGDAPLESVSVTTGAASGATSLGTISTLQVSDSGNLNHLHRIGLGSNRWKTSAVRQWLNSSSTGGSWWTPQTKWDRPPSYVNYAGFLSMLPEDLVAVMKPVRVVTAVSYVADSGTSSTVDTDVTYDRVFLPSWEQHYLAVSASYGGKAGTEGSLWEYWKGVAGTSSPLPASTSGNTSTYHPEYCQYDMSDGTTARNVFMRSATRAFGGNVAGVFASGICGSNLANYGYFVAPACAIG